MDPKEFTYTGTIAKLDGEKSKSLNKAKGDCDDLESSSHTQYFRRKKYLKTHYERITSDEYLGKFETLSGSSDTHHCVYGPTGKPYTEKGRLERSFRKILDPIVTDPKRTEECELPNTSQLASTLEFLVTDCAGQMQTTRIQALIRDFARASRSGYNIEVLPSLCVVLEHLVERMRADPALRESAALLLDNMDKPILLRRVSDITTQFDTLRHYIGFLGYLLLQVGEDELFGRVSRALSWQLSARRVHLAQGERGKDGAATARLVLGAAALLLPTAARMLALARPTQFPAYQHIALLLACHSVHNCIEMIKENIIENILCRFNPYFPDELPSYEMNPAYPEDVNVRLGDSSVHMSTTLSLLLVLLKTLKSYLDENPDRRTLIPHPDYYAQRCFIWAYRYECRARDHRHERAVLTVIAHILLHCFGERLMAFSSLLMPDIMTLSVLTEIPPREDWTRTVSFNTAQADVHFKKLLIYLSVDFLKTFSYNSFMVESQHWLLGLMFLVDPGLCSLRAHWSQSLYSELRKTTLQALVCTLPIMPQRLVQEYDIIRRLIWYIEWYSESPYELPVLYWCVRVLQLARPAALGDLFDTHGIIILMHLMYTLLEQRCPPVERAQAVVALGLRVLTSAADTDARLCCQVYPLLAWPTSLAALARNMLGVVLHSLDKHLLISDRWLISLLNFIWETIIWKKEFREKFILKNGVYNLLDIVTLTYKTKYDSRERVCVCVSQMSSGEVQALALAIACDAARAGHVVQLLSWRAPLGASNAYPSVVKRGATIANLLAAVFRDECAANGVKLNEYGIIQNLEYPMMSMEMHEEMRRPDDSDIKSRRTPVCLPAAELAGSRMSKAFSLLQLLSEDLAHKVAVADETYRLYKNIQLEAQDEIILVLCSHYLTFKLTETWYETKIQSSGLLGQDDCILNEFLQINSGWAKDVKHLQEAVLEKHHNRERDEESSLYEFLKRVRLNSALDALREVRCAARSARAPVHRSPPALAHCAPPSSPTPLATYRPPLDDQNATGQYVKVYSIQPKSKSSPRITRSAS